MVEAIFLALVNFINLHVGLMTKAEHHNLYLKS